MSGMATQEYETLEDKLQKNEYPGRGIVLGKSEDGKNAVAVYFIMGRSTNSRNRVFIEEDGNLRTQAFDPSKLEDPSLIIYFPVRTLGDKTIVTNGDQTDTIFDGLKKGLTFSQALESRTYEPDEPNFTPRISGLQEIKDGKYSFKLSILKSDPTSLAEKPHCPATIRNTFDYEYAQAGTGRFIHTYMANGNPLPTFEGEPETVRLKGDIDSLSASVWESLNEENKISLYVRFTNIETGEVRTKVINKNK